MMALSLPSTHGVAHDVEVAHNIQLEYSSEAVTISVLGSYIVSTLLSSCVMCLTHIIHVVK